MHDLLLRNGFTEYQRGNLDEAARLYGEVLRSDPLHVDALCLIGILYAQKGETVLANAAADRALQRRDRNAASAYRLGCLLQTLGRHEDARDEFDRALAVNPNAFEVLVHRGISLMALSAPGAALESFDRALALRPLEAGIWHNRANALLLLERFVEAVLNYDWALAIKAGFAQAWENRGKALTRIGRHEEALVSYDRAVAVRPDDVRLWNLRGAAFNTLRRFEEAAANSSAVLAANPDEVAALLIRGSAHHRLGWHADALADIDRAMAADPSHKEAGFARADALNGLGRYREALVSVDSFLKNMPGDTGALVTKGVALNALGSREDALAVYGEALAADPDCIEALMNRGGLLGDLRRFEEAASDFNRLLAIRPDLDYVHGLGALLRLQVCDWRGIGEDRKRLSADIAAGKPVVPFVALAYSYRAPEQLACAETYVRQEHTPVTPSLWQGERYRHERIRLAYASADFRQHAMSKQMAGVFDHHDRQRFETIAISYGPDDASPLRRRVENGFERFIDASGKTSLEIAGLMRRMEIDVAIDLMGYTTGARPDIFRLRPAPVQASYLGFPGTSGASYMDYIIADSTVIPEAYAGCYRESVVRLPDTYYPADSRLEIAGITPVREQADLPPAGFVFCSFNNIFKIMLEMFAIWMRLLQAAEGSVLWLLGDNQAAMRNLRHEAEARGVGAERLVFAPRAETSEHLARHRLADLFLDTLPYNAHTTACDALWAGVPVVTTQGQTFAGRVAASVLQALGLPELIASSLTEYESLAQRLARDPAALAGVKAKLGRNRDTYPLFDTGRLTRHLEAAYAAMWARAQEGLAPESFSVPPDVSLTP